MKFDKTIAFNTGKLQALTWIAADAPTVSVRSMIATVIFHLLEDVDFRGPVYLSQLQPLLEHVMFPKPVVAEPGLNKGAAWLLASLDLALLINRWNRGEVVAAFLDGYLAGLGMETRHSDDDVTKRLRWLIQTRTYDNR